MRGFCGGKMPLVSALKTCHPFELYFWLDQFRDPRGRQRQQLREGGLKSSSSWGEWNSSGSFTAFRMTATTKTTATATALSDPFNSNYTVRSPSGNDKQNGNSRLRGWMTIEKVVVYSRFPKAIERAFSPLLSSFPQTWGCAPG